MARREAPAVALDSAPPPRASAAARWEWLRTVAAPLLLLSVLAFAAELSGPLNHDVGWLLDAGSRWAAGQRLYVDIVELNPPLIFYLYGLLTAGTFTKIGFVAGMVVAMAVSAVWAARLNGRRWGAAAFLVCLSSGILDFGQRDHFAAIVAIPYLWADRARRGERMLIGVWSFLGFALKPYLMLIPLGATVGRMVRERSLRPALSPENLVLLALSLAYVAAVAVAYPAYFQTIIPLGRLVYFAYGNSFPGEPLTAAAFALSIIAAVAAARSRLWPEAGAIGGALASFLLQDRFWTYHLVPAFALALLVLLMLLERARRERAFGIALAVMAAALLVPVARPDYWNPIPAGARSVLFLSAKMSAAYPGVFDRGVVNASPYPQLWTLPGAWRLLHDRSTDPARRRAAVAVLDDTRRRLVATIVRDCPNPIFADERPSLALFGAPFDYVAFLAADPRFGDYRAAGRVANYRIYYRTGPCGRRAR